ncbi:PIN domain-like protein [Mycena filopes]|nr:PIN domain-like protein [Mycena filopes]
MGVNKLWKIIAPAVETRSLLNLATIEGFDCNNRGLRTLVVGVDISIRTSAIVKVLQGANIFHPGPGGDKLLLEKMFYQLCQFSRAPLTPVFVFDGPDRPPIKRGIRVMNHAAPVIQHLKTMIRAFGFHVHDAPGEAEAELAQLNRNDDIDAIITEDSDAFVFGATCVIRTLGPSVHDSSVIFTSQSIENSVSLDEGGLFLCALILGGDYGPGLKGAGTTVAHALAAEGFGGALAAILRSSTGVERRQRLAVWRNQLSQELKTNSSGRLGKRQTQLADNIPDSFPDVQVAELYLNPWTSRSAGFTGRCLTLNLGSPRSQTSRSSRRSALCASGGMVPTC